jgi:MFS family permease
MPTPLARRRERTAVRGAFLGFLIDNFDIYLPIVVLAPARSYFLPHSLHASTIALVSSWVFVATLVGRPVGSLCFGLLADKVGRRRSTTIAGAGFATTTLLVACLPGYAAWGIGAVAALIALRFTDGVFLGGEYAGANTLAMEESPRHRRGLNGGLVQSGAPLAWVVIGLLTLLMLKLAPAGGPHSAYAVWGWRVPFLVGAALSVGFVAYYRRRVTESEVWRQDRDSASSGSRLPSRGGLVNFAQVFVLMTGMWLLLYSITAILPAYLTGPMKLASTPSTAALIVMYAVLTLIFVGGGALSQVTGRRPYLIGAAAVAGAAGIPAYLLITRAGPTGPGQAALLVTLAGALIVCPWPVVTAYLAERFRTQNRATGFGLGYSLAVIIPSFYATYQNWLSALVPARDTVLVLAAIGAFLVLVAATAGPETKDVEFTAATDNSHQNAETGQATQNTHHVTETVQGAAR